MEGEVCMEEVCTEEDMECKHFINTFIKLNLIKKSIIFNRGGMYGGGMGMMGMDPNNPGLLQHSMQYLHSLGYVIMSLSEISRNLEMNADGLARFWTSLYNLTLRIKV